MKRQNDDIGPCIQASVIRAKITCKLTGDLTRLSFSVMRSSIYYNRCTYHYSRKGHRSKPPSHLSKLKGHEGTCVCKYYVRMNVVGFSREYKFLHGF